MKSGVSIVKDNLKKVMVALNSFPDKDVLVGIPADTTARKNDIGGAVPVSEMTNAQLGYIHEFGAPEHNIPARPFLYPGLRGVKTHIAAYFKQYGLAAMKGSKEGMDRALHSMGILGMNAVRRKITVGPFVPLKASTLAARRRRGRTGTRPLIDTGQLRAAITYVIRSKK